MSRRLTRRNVIGDFERVTMSDLSAHDFCVMCSRDGEITVDQPDGSTEWWCRDCRTQHDYWEGLTPTERESEERAMSEYANEGKQ